MNDKITVKDAAKEGHVTPHTIREWIAANKIIAENVGSLYLIDRTSFDRHLATRNPAKSQPEFAAERKSVEIETGPLGQQVETTGGVDIKAPPDLRAGADLASKPNERIASFAPPASEVQAEMAMQSAAASENAGAGIRPQSKAQMTERPPHGSSSGRAEKKRQTKAAVREVKRKIKKSPVHYAKNAMRHLSRDQYHDIIAWILRRIDREMKPV